MSDMKARLILTPPRTPESVLAIAQMDSLDTLFHALDTAMEATMVITLLVHGQDGKFFAQYQEELVEGAKRALFDRYDKYIRATMNALADTQQPLEESYPPFQRILSQVVLLTRQSTEDILRRNGVDILNVIEDPWPEGETK